MPGAIFPVRDFVAGFGVVIGSKRESAGDVPSICVFWQRAVSQRPVCFCCLAGKAGSCKQGKYQADAQDGAKCLFPSLPIVSSSFLMGFGAALCKVFAFNCLLSGKHVFVEWNAVRAVPCSVLWLIWMRKLRNNARDLENSATYCIYLLLYTDDKLVQLTEFTIFTEKN